MRIWGLGFGVWGLWFGVNGIGFRVWRLGSTFVDRCLTTASPHSSASLELDDYPQVDMLGLRNKAVNFGAGKRPGSPYRSAQIDRHRTLQGYIAHEKLPPPPYDHRRALGTGLLVLGGGSFL